MIYEIVCEQCGKGARFCRTKEQSKPRYCSFGCRVDAQRNQEPVISREWLVQKYLVEKLGCREIGEVVGRDAKTILYWLRKFDIPTRPRGHNRDQNLPNGRQPGWNHTEEAKAKVGAASRARGAVPYLRNGKHWMDGLPSEQVPSWKGGVTPERQAFYSTDEWRIAVKAIWTRDDAKCQRCGLDARDFTAGSGKFHVHHIVSFAVEHLRAEPSNLILLCNECHYWVHSNENTEQDFISHLNGAHA